MFIDLHIIDVSQAVRVYGQYIYMGIVPLLVKFTQFHHLQISLFYIKGGLSKAATRLICAVLIYFRLLQAQHHNACIAVRIVQHSALPGSPRGVPYSDVSQTQVSLSLHVSSRDNLPLIIFLPDVHRKRIVCCRYHFFGHVILVSKIYYLIFKVQFRLNAPIIIQ